MSERKLEVVQSGAPGRWTTILMVVITILLGLALWWLSTTM